MVHFQICALCGERVCWGGPMQDNSCHSSSKSHHQVNVWVEDGELNFIPASLCDDSSIPLLDLTAVSAKDIFINFSALEKQSAKVLVHGSTSYVDIPVMKIHMCHNGRGTDSDHISLPGGIDDNRAESDLPDMLSLPTNLPSLLVRLQGHCQKGTGCLAKVGPVYLALQAQGQRQWVAEEEALLKPVVEAALRSLAAGSCSSLILSGFSGSGKTVAFRRIAQLVSGRSGSNPLSPLLEAGISVLDAFGSISTPLSAHCSRFSKHLRLTMQRDSTLLHAHMTAFLLEKRLASPANCGDSFRIFSLLLASVLEGDNSEEDIGVYPGVTYKGFKSQGGLTSESCASPDGVGASLLEEYRGLVQQLDRLGVGAERRLQLFRVLGAVLLLRNLTFVKKTASGVPSKVKEELKDRDPSAECMVDEDSFEVRRIGELLGLKEGSVGDLLSKKFVSSVRKDDSYFINLTFEQASHHANMVAENLYEAVFSWLTSSHCNALWSSGGGLSRPPTRLIEHFVDVLDIASLVELESNRFDQLMTNYCCEKVQKYICSDLFGSEGVGGSGSGCLSLLDGEAGILSLVDEHCLLSRAGQDDSTLFQLICSTHASKSRRLFSRSSKAKPSGGGTKINGGDLFVVKHFSDISVTYSVEGFMRSNRGEKLDKELCSSFEASSNSVLADIFGMINDEQRSAQEQEKTNSRRVKSKIKRTEISLAKRDVSQTLNDLQSTTPIYIKCIRLSATIAPTTVYDSQYVARQLQAHCVTDLINLKLWGFSSVYSWEEIHAILISNNLYHFGDNQALLVGGLSGKQCQGLARDIFLRCSALTRRKFWQEQCSEAGARRSAGCRVQADALDLLLYFKKMTMKAVICRAFRAHCRKKRFDRERHSRDVLARFFYSVTIWKRWKRSIAALMIQFAPLKLFLLRWITSFRVRKRWSCRILNLFLCRREWRSRVQVVLSTERAARLALHTAKAKVMQKYWRGYFTRRSLYSNIIVVVRERLLVKKLQKMAWRIYRKYRPFSLKCWVKEITYAIRWNRVTEVEHLLFRDGRVSSNRADKANTRPPKSGGASLLHLAVGLQLAPITHLLLLAGADPLAFDSCGIQPLALLAGQPPTLQRAETLSVLLFHCHKLLQEKECEDGRGQWKLRETERKAGGGLLCYPSRAGVTVDEESLCEGCAEGGGADLFGVQCGRVSLAAALGELASLKQRAARKKHHREQVSQGGVHVSCSLIDLIDPADWVSPLVFKGGPVGSEISGDSATEKDAARYGGGGEDEDTGALCLPNSSEGSSSGGCALERRRERDVEKMTAAAARRAQKRALRASIFSREESLGESWSSSDEEEQQHQRELAAAIEEARRRREEASSAKELLKNTRFCIERAVAEAMAEAASLSMQQYELGGSLVESLNVIVGSDRPSAAVQEQSDPQVDKSFISSLPAPARSRNEQHEGGIGSATRSLKVAANAQQRKRAA